VRSIRCRTRWRPTSLLVLAEDGDGTGLYAVDTSSGGVCAADPKPVDQTRNIFNVTLDDVSGQRLASASEADVQALVDDVLIAYAADALGAATAVMNLAVEYAKVRRQFDQPIGSFQAVQHLCVDMYETVELARSGATARAVGGGCRTTQRSATWPRCAPRHSRANSPPSPTPAIQVFGGSSATRGSTTPTCISSACSAGAPSSVAPTDYLQEVGRHSLRPCPANERLCNVRGFARSARSSSWHRGRTCRLPVQRWRIGVPTSSRWRTLRAGPGSRAGDSADSRRTPPGLTSTSSSRSETAASAASRSTSNPKPGREYLGRLLATADVFLTNWLPAPRWTSAADGRGHSLVQPEHHHRPRHQAPESADLTPTRADSTRPPTCPAAGCRTR